MARGKMEKRGDDYPALTVRGEADLDEPGLKSSLSNRKQSIITFTLAAKLEPDVHVIALWEEAVKPGENLHRRREINVEKLKVPLILKACKICPPRLTSPLREQ